MSVEQRELLMAVDAFTNSPQTLRAGKSLSTQE